MPTPGYVYVLINASMPELCKVGKTTREPEARALELSSATGVPSPFLLAFQCRFADCDGAELFIHRALEFAGYRVSESREFFSAPLHEVVRIVISAPGALLGVGTPQDDGDEDASEDSPTQSSADQLFDLACAYHEGTVETLQNPHKALQLFEQAAALGHRGAIWHAGWCHEQGNGTACDLHKALDWYKRLVALGRSDGWTDQARVFQTAGQNDAASHCWTKYAEAALQAGADNETVGAYLAGYVGAVTSEADKRLPHTLDDHVLVAFAPSIRKALTRRVAELRGKHLDYVAVIYEAQLRWLELTEQGALAPARLAEVNSWLRRER